MARIEVIFGSALGVALVVAGAFAAIDGRLPFFTSPDVHAITDTLEVRGERGSGGDGVSAALAAQAMNTEEMPAFTGDVDVDRCSCYQRAFAVSRKATAQGEDVSLHSVTYAGGYKSCRAQLGSAGANAWALGWSNGRDERVIRRSCRYIISATK